jgi:anti-anti-sigma factor
MPPQPGDPLFQVEQASAATVVRLDPQCGDHLDNETIQRLGDLLVSLVADEGRHRLVVNLAGIDRLDSLLLGKLVQLHKRALAAGGRVVLCDLSPRLYETFQILQLTNFLRIYGTEAEAVASF